jgi:Dyp-type peroxidase family
MPVDYLVHSEIDPQADLYRPLLEHLQGNILKSHGREHSACVFLRFTAVPDAAARWLGRYADAHVTSALAQWQQSQRFKAAVAQSSTTDEAFCNVFVSAAGYRYLGFDPAHFGSGGAAFRNSMKQRPRTLPQRASALLEKLLDIGNKEPDPSVWEAPYRADIHAMILLARDDAAALHADVSQLAQTASTVAEIVTIEHGNVLRAPSVNGVKGTPIEHFGFADGRSNPVFYKSDIDKERAAGMQHYDPSAPLSLVLVRDPFAPHPEHCGSYLVFRKLQQNTIGFHEQLAQLATKLGVQAQLAGAMAVGRFADGTPIALQGEGGMPTIPNDFSYKTHDPDAARVPHHAHIRKTNPRGAFPLSRFFDDRQRRIVRRGIPYGALGDTTPGAVGLLFMCFQSDIHRQFEHIQRRWADSRLFPRSLLFWRAGNDPLLGQRRDAYSRQRWRTQWGGSAVLREHFGGFVGLRGGEYFFTPSIAFFRRLAQSGGGDMAGENAAVLGAWAQPPYNSEIEAVHAALLNNGKVVYFSGFRVAEAVKTETRLWNPKTGEIKTVPTPSDLFCAGHSFLLDGRLLVTGGTLEYRNLPPFPPWLVRLTLPIQPFLVRTFEGRIPVNLTPTGSTFLYLFDPRTEQWAFGGDMAEGRWYPTNTSLPDGRVLLLSGTNEGGGYKGTRPVEINRRVELYDAKTGLEEVATIPSFKQPKPHADAFVAMHSSGPDATGGEFPSTYPRMFVLPRRAADTDAFPAGKAFCAGYHPHTKFLNLATWAWTPAGHLEWGPRDDGCCVLLPLRPPDYTPRVLTFGGARQHDGKLEVTETAEIIDLSADEPKWRVTTPMHDKRLNAVGVLLADGKVMVVGGNSTGRFDDPILRPELFDEATEQWTPLASASVPRGYHATALLLADGRVLSAGTTPFGHHELRMEIYSPYYLFKGERPRITRAPKAVAYGQSFDIAFTCKEGTIAQIALIRPGSVTHAFDMEQRYIELSIAELHPDHLVTNAPPDAYIAPPGYYMLFLLNDRGVPSEAAFVNLH